jgi:hypothetical protein
MAAVGWGNIVGEVGLEPTRPFEHGLLRPACLPISALAQRCGEGGIRTLDRIAPITVFETARFNHSRTSPELD